MKYQTLGNVLNNLIKDLGIEEKIDENKAIAIWPEIVGTNVSCNSEVEIVKDGILFVKVKSDVWRNELIFLKFDLIKKLNEKIGKKIIVDIRFS